MSCKFIFILGSVILGLTATCNHKQNADLPTETNKIEINAPVPASQISNLGLNKSQQDCVDSANDFAFKCLRALYEETGETNIVFSPLSLQYALAMVLNGASGETAREIMTSIGYSGDVQNLNSFMNLLIEQLPAIDTSVVLRVANAMLVNKSFKADSSFVSILNNNYYSPIEYVNVNKGEHVVERINEWANRNTNGFINPFIEKSDIGDDFVASLLNALYFKAKWAGSDSFPMFRTEATLLSQPFFIRDGSAVSVDYLRTSRYLRYSEYNGYRVVDIPYADGKFSMFVVLPNSHEDTALKRLLGTLSEVEWEHLITSLKEGPEVHLRLPKFDIENRFDLPDVLRQLGVIKAFVPGQAEFDKMFGKNDFWIGNVIQKARIKVTEWGTEAAAVTAVTMIGDYIPEDYKEVYFYADHPFAYIIAERNTGLVLFEGVYTGLMNSL